MTDADLLRRYTDDASESAFASLVERHLNLVYSVARRHVRSSSLAEDVAQSVFIELARNARRIKPGAPLVAWLHLVSRRTALNAARGEMRRQIRETAAVDLAAMKPNPSAWDAIEPLLDEAVEALNATDRSAILLRFFENKSLREIGAALGTTEAAAQKRVTRALEQLRTIFARRGIALTAAGLVTDLSAHAIQTAPAALSAAISSGTVSLSAAAFQTAAFETTKTFAMTTLQKSAIGTALVLAAAAGVYETTVFARQKSTLAAMEQNAFDVESQLQQQRAQHTDANTRLKSVEEEIDVRLAAANARLHAGDPALESQMKTWLANLDRMKQFVVQHPNLGIPGMELISEETWFEAAAGAELDSERSVREALSKVRQKAENLLGNKVRNALNAYLKANDGVLPNHISQLRPFLDSPAESLWLDRYEMLRSGKLSDVPAQNKMEIISVKAPIDIEHDALLRIGADGFSMRDAMRENVAEARRAFSAANAGQPATTATQLMPYLKWPVSETAVQKYLLPATPRRP